MRSKKDFIIPIVIFLITCIVVGLIIVFVTYGQTADKPSVTPSASATVTSSGDASTVNPSDATSASASPSIIPEYAVMFLTADGTPIPAQTVASGAYATVPTETVVRNGYNFDGWNYDFTTPITSDTIITAKWTAIEYNITYVLGDGSNNPINPSTYTIESGEITLALPTKAYYNGTWNNGGVIPAGSTGDKTFTAIYTAIEYTITYVLGNGAINNASNPTTYTIESSDITLEAPVRTGYDFVGWSGGGVITAGSAGDKTFTANWNLITYNINYVLGDGSNNTSNPSTYTVESGAITLAAPTKAGYNGSWDNGGVIPAGSTGDKTFTASYELITYNINYVLNNGTNDSNNPSTYTIESADIILLDAVRDGWEFVKWVDADNVTVTVILSGSYGDITLTAIFEEIPVTLSLKSDDTYEVTGLKNPNTNINVVIKSSYNGIPVTSIGNRAFVDKKKMESIVIPDSVTSIANQAFYYCVKLRSVTLPETLVSIGAEAFYYCYSLTTITLPESLESIGGNAFGVCPKLVEVYNKSNTLTVTKGGTDNGLVGRFAKEVYTAPYTSKLSLDSNGYLLYTDGADVLLISYWGTETVLTIPSAVTEIYQYALFKETSLTSVTMSDNVTVIGDNAFLDNISLQSITLSDNLISLGNTAFQNCSKLTEITLPNSLEYIGKNAFTQSILTNVTFGETNGWSADGTSIPSADLSDPSTAASYLRSTYRQAIWTRT